MTPKDITLWGYGTVRQLRPHWMLNEMGLEYDFHAIHPRTGQTFEPDFLKMNPRHKVPVMRHGDMVITESAAIVQYIGEAFESPPHMFVPRNSVERAKLNEWCFFIMTELDAGSLYVIRRHTNFASIYGESTVACAAAKIYFEDQLSAIAPVVDDSGTFLFGDRLSAADILMCTCLDWAVELNFVLPGGLVDYHQRLIERSAYIKARVRTFADPKAALPATFS